MIPFPHYLTQKYPEYRVASVDDPVYDNLRPYYIFREDIYSVERRIRKELEQEKERELRKPRIEMDLNLNEPPIKDPIEKSSIPVEEIRIKIHKEEKRIVQQTANSISVEKDNSFSLGELLALPDNQQKFLLDLLLPGKALSVLGGKSDVGKSLLYTQLALAIIYRDEFFCGFKLNIRTGRVLIIATEDGPEILKDRIVKQITGRQIRDDLNNSLILESYSTDVLQVIEKHLAQGSFDLIIIDAFSDVFLGNINAVNDVRVFMNKILALVSGHECAVLFVHHEGKSNSTKGPEKNRLLGSVGIEGKCRSVLSLSKAPGSSDIRVIKVVKGNYVSEEVKSKQYYLNLNPETLQYSVASDYDAINTKKYPMPFKKQYNTIVKRKAGRRGPPKEEYELAEKMHLEGKTLKEIGELLNKDPSTICRWFKPKPMYDTKRVGRVD